MADISVAANQQNAGVSQVSDAVSQMDHATQQNAALVEESAASAESLREQSMQLVAAVAEFKLTASAKTHAS
jgi:methyl-accepting chemotaxis protein